jgi:hypothetical protein
VGGGEISVSSSSLTYSADLTDFADALGLLTVSLLTVALAVPVGWPLAAAGRAVAFLERVTGAKGASFNSASWFFATRPPRRRLAD